MLSTLQPVLKHDFAMTYVHYFTRRGKHIHDITYNNEVHQLCPFIQPYLIWPIFKVSRSSYLQIYVLCLGEKDVSVTSYITLSTSQNYECHAMKSKRNNSNIKYQNSRKRKNGFL